MAGNRMKLKNGLFVTMLLATPFFGYGLEKEQIETFSRLTEEFDTWGQKLLKPKNTTKAGLLGELQVILLKLESLVSSVPDTPPADSLIKTMITDLTDGLKNTHTTLSHVRSLTDLKKVAGSNCSLQPMLDKAQQDLCILIAHVEAHKELYGDDVLKALKKYESTTFRKFYNNWHPKGVKEWLGAFMRWFTLK